MADVDLDLRSAREWQELFPEHDRIVDPDGWRAGDGVTLDTPITYPEYVRRLGQCTVAPPFVLVECVCGETGTLMPRAEADRLRMANAGPWCDYCPDGPPWRADWRSKVVVGALGGMRVD